MFKKIMKAIRTCLAALASLLLILLIAGCQTDGVGGSGMVKTVGVYTTLVMTNHDSFDMPGSGYMQKSAFGPGETPAAVIVGYGKPNQPEMLTLELLESSTGRSLFSTERYGNYGMAAIQPLHVRLSGEYKVKLKEGETLLDSVDFSVVRTNNAGVVLNVNTNSSAEYAKGIIGVGMRYTRTAEVFDDYDGRLNYLILNAVNKETSSSSGAMLVQRPPGQVVMQCRLDYHGKVTDTKLIENTLDEELGRLFQRVVLAKAPYPAWPDGAREKLGADDRVIKIILSLE